MKSSGIGGQAVLEGVMMKNKDKYAIAVRKPDNEITVEISEYRGIDDKYTFFKLPVLRGVAAFGDSMVIGIKALSFSSSFYEEGEEQAKKDKKSKKNNKDENKSENITEKENESKANKTEKESKGSDSFLTFIMLLCSIVLAIGIFIILPFFLSGLVSQKINSQIILSLIEGAIRILLFVGYVVAISQMNDIKRFFQYHGAEHKTINCIEQGYDLTVENVRRQSKEHKRCGTSFMLFVMLISIIFFMFIHVDVIWLRYVLRILLIPVIAGLSYEVIRLAGRTNNIVVRIISAPGMWMQNLTTKEPDDSMIEVAIQSVEAVFDWKAFLIENKLGKYGKKMVTNKKKKVSTVSNQPNEQGSKKESEKGSKKAELQKSNLNNNDKALNKKSQDNKSVAKKLLPAEELSATMELTALEEVSDTMELTALEELSSLDKNLFEPHELAPEEKKNQLKEKVKPSHTDRMIRSTEIAASLEPNDDEDDVILKALDRYLSFDKEDRG